MDSDSPPPPLSWPPPGLHRLQGDLGRVTAKLGTGATIFTLPLLASVAIPQELGSLGLFGEAWWILLVTSVVGLAVIGDGFVGLFRLLRRSARAVDRGYSARTVALVLADRTRDTGFLIQGARAYSVMAGDARRTVVTARLAGELLLLAASLWLAAGFAIGILVAARGMLDERGLALWTLAPAALLVAVAVALRLREGLHVRRARREWFRQPWSADLEASEIERWHGALADRPDALPLPMGRRGGGAPVRWALGGSLLVPLVIVLVCVPLVGMAAVGPVLATVAVPSFGPTQQRAAVAQAVAPYRLPPDNVIDAREAGDALIALGSVGELPTHELARRPARTYDAAFFPGDVGRTGGPTGMPPAQWAERLMPQVASELDPETIRWLDSVGDHPALAELRRLAYASTLDEGGAARVSPLPPSTSVMEIPIPRMTGVREAAYAHIGGAIADAARGRTEDAEVRLREVISAGMLLGQEGSSLITNLVGYVLVGTGGEALAGLWEATGRAEEATALRGWIDTAERIAAVAHLGPPATPGAALAGMPDVVTDPNAIRGVRWELFMTLNTLGPCMNPNRSVFGTGPEFDAWVAEAREGLVRSEAEAELFRLAGAGWLGLAAEESLAARATRLLVGDPRPGSCAAMLSAMVR